MNLKSYIIDCEYDGPVWVQVSYFCSLENKIVSSENKIEESGQGVTARFLCIWIVSYLDILA